MKMAKSKVLLCMTMSCMLFGCGLTESGFTITYINGDTKTTVNVKDGEILKDLLPLEEKVGYDAYWSIDGVKIETGMTYDYGADKEAIAVYVPHKWKIIFDNDEHTKLDVTYDQTIGELPPLPTKTGYLGGNWKIEDTIITANTIYKWDKDSFATADLAKATYTLSFEGLSETSNIEVSYDSIIGKLPEIPAFEGKLSEHYEGYWTIDGEIIDENYVWNYEGNKVAKPLYKAFLNDLKNGSNINVMSESIQDLYASKEETPTSSGSSLLDSAKSHLADNVDLANIAYKLSWTEIKPFQYSLVRVGEEEDLSDAKTYLTYNHYVTLSDLNPNSDYFYQIEGFDDDESIKSDIYSFAVSDGAKIVSIDGIDNFRDIGAYKTAFANKKMKSGMIYRSANADAITPLGKKQIVNLYGIKTELDLREESYWSSESYFGTDVQYKHVSNKQGGVYYIMRGDDSSDETGIATGGATLKEELSVFTNVNNYPINFHCAIGRDRTGTLAMILLGLLGVSESDICFDYVISTINGSAKASDETHLQELYSNIYQTMQHIKTLTGKTQFSEAVYSYLTTNFTGENAKATVGLTEEEVASIKNAMLEDK